MPLATVSGRKVYYEVHGTAAGTPLVLVMGMAGSCKGWLALQVPDFAPAHRTLIYENRGVGESEDPGGAFTTADLADDLAGLLDALEGPPRARARRVPRRHDRAGAGAPASRPRREADPGRHLRAPRREAAPPAREVARDGAARSRPRRDGARAPALDAARRDARAGRPGGRDGVELPGRRPADRSRRLHAPVRRLPRATTPSTACARSASPPS